MPIDQTVKSILVVLFVTARLVFNASMPYLSDRLLLRGYTSWGITGGWGLEFLIHKLLFVRGGSSLADAGVGYVKVIVTNIKYGTVILAGWGYVSNGIAGYVYLDGSLEGREVHLRKQVAC